MTRNIGEIEALFITPLDGAPAATVDGLVPSVLEIGAFGLARYGVDSRSYQVVRYHGPEADFEPINPGVLAAVGIDVDYDKMTFTHPAHDQVSMAVTPSLQPAVQPEVTTFFSEVVGEDVRLVGPLHHHGSSYSSGVLPSHDHLFAWQNTLRLAVTDVPGSILVDPTLPQPLIPGVDVVVTGDQQALVPGQSLVVHRPGAESHADFTGWINAIQNVGLAGFDYRVADMQYHRDAAGLRIAVGNKLQLK